MSDESATSRVEKLLNDLMNQFVPTEVGEQDEWDSRANEILDIVRKQDERIASLEETIEILSGKDRLKVLEKGAESAREHGSRPYEVKR